MKKAVWKEYFTFSKKERFAVFILFGIIIFFFVLPYFYSREFSRPVVDQKLQQQLEALENTHQDSTVSSNSSESQTTSVSLSSASLFYFDPNRLNAEGFRQLGLRDKTIQTLINYRNKGGHFKQPEDIYKIYGLGKEEADRLIPYIRFTPVEDNGKEAVAQLSQHDPDYKKLDINTATAEEWKTLPGIGDVLSNRIVKFRNSLHGFTSVEDIRRTYGLTDSVFQLIVPYLTISDSTGKSE